MRLEFKAEMNLDWHSVLSTHHSFLSATIVSTLVPECSQPCPSAILLTLMLAFLAPDTWNLAPIHI